MPEDNMTERLPRTRTEQLGQQETEGRQEILNFKEYGALYGRFLLASQAKTAEEAANIINPNKTVSLLRDLQTKDNALALEKRNYNLVAEKSSIAERKEIWEGVEYSKAKDQWLTEFTGFMKTIKKDSDRELALHIILPGVTAASFEEVHAEQLFNKFCNEGKSDIHAFTSMVASNLGSIGKRDSSNLQTLLPELQWIASGLFGKNTASQIVTRLIELESAMRNDVNLVLETLLSNEQIHNPTDDEKQILNALYKGEIPSLTPQEKIIPAEEIKVTVPIVPGEGVSKPAPVTPEPDKGRDEPPSPPPNVPKSEAKDLSDAQPQATERSVEKMTAEKTEEIGQILDFTDELLAWQHGKYEIRIRKFSFGRSIYFYVNNQSVESSYTDQLVSEDFDLASAIKDLKGIEPDTAEKIYQALAKRFSDGLEKEDLLCIDLLKNFPDIEFNVPDSVPNRVFTVKKSLYGSRLIYEHNGMGMSKDEIERIDPKIKHSLDILIGNKLLETWIKSSQTPSTPPSPAETVPKPKTAGENVVSSEEPKNNGETVPTAEQTIGGTEKIIIMPPTIISGYFDSTLNHHLWTNKDESHITFVYDPNELKEHMLYTAKGFDIEGGDIEVVKDNQITISHLRIAKLGIGVTLDLALSNDKDGIAAKITKFHRDFLARANRASSREEVERQIKNINSTIKEHLNKMITDQALWFAGNISIAEGKVRVEFEKLPEATTAAETLESQISVKEPKAKVEIIPISERDDFSDRSVKLKIGGQESGIVWDQPKDGREPRKGEFHLIELRKEKGKLMLSNGTRLRISKVISTSKSNEIVAIIITGGRNTAIDIPDLIYFKDHDLSISLQTNDSESWASADELYEETGAYEERGKCIFTYSPGFTTDKNRTIHGLSVKNAIALLKESLRTEDT